MELASIARKPFDELLALYRAGDQNALAELFHLYNAVIRAAVRRRMSERLRKEFDSLDFAQDVWASFCAIPAERRDFKSPTALHAFLVKVAENKIVDTYRRRIQSASRSAARECDLKKSPASNEPTPSQWAIAGERWSMLSSELQPSHLAVVEHLRAGYSCQEIAERLDTSLRTITRILDRVQRLCQEKR